MDVNMVPVRRIAEIVFCSWVIVNTEKMFAVEKTRTMCHPTGAVSFDFDLRLHGFSGRWQSRVT